MAIGDTLGDDWVVEACDRHGCAFALRVTRKLHDERSAIQRLEVYQTSDWGKLLLLDGCTMVSDRDSFIYHEMLSHPALFIHPDPRRVAIIGGGDCGTLREVLKHSAVRSATQIDIDERVTRVAERFFPALCDANDDPRATLVFEDGLAWLRGARPEALDVLIVDSTDPIGAGAVLYGEAFFAACYAALAAGGILVQQSESPLVHGAVLETLHRRMWAAGFSAVRTAFFPLPIYPTGWWSATLAAKQADLTGLRAADVSEPAFRTEYYNAGIHRAAFAMPEFFKRASKVWAPAGCASVIRPGPGDFMPPSGFDRGSDA